MHARGLGRKDDGIIIKILQKKVKWKPHEINLELETYEISLVTAEFSPIFV